MDRESFLETVRKQIAEEIHEAYMSCESATGDVDFDLLRKKISKIGKAAKVQGLAEKDFEDLLGSELPQKVKYTLDSCEYKKAS